MNETRFDRNVRFFGNTGQERLRTAKVAIVGIGGLGTHVVQQLTHLGVGHLVAIDDEDLDESNLNRYVGTRHNDVIRRTHKVDIAERLVKEIDPSIDVTKIHNSLRSKQAFTALPGVDCVFGCLDNDGARLILTELCSAHTLPLFDLASEIIPDQPPLYGGRVAACVDGTACLACMDLIDFDEARTDLDSPQSRQDREDLYGVDREHLGHAGPSVIAINGTVASLAVTEFFLWLTGIRHPKRLLEYRGNLGIVTKNTDPPNEDCHYCKAIRGKPQAANIERYLPVPKQPR
ncbi:MAG: ThiF family adenylyltransferase [Planctomycetes bacterium]|nr:ThiF family adenylyltransferase [Planctomycetota bacterium]